MQHAHEHDHHHALSEAAQTARDPVCGMQVDPSQSEHHMDHDGIGYVFCSRGCQEKFAQDPDRYLQPAPAPKTIEDGGYTCPMHPEVVQDGPGSCPKCGMALEPMVVTGQEEADRELRDMTRRFWISVLLTVPVVILAMGHLVGLPVYTWLPVPLSTWLELILATPVVLWGGKPFFVPGYHVNIRLTHTNKSTAAHRLLMCRDVLRDKSVAISNMI